MNAIDLCNNALALLGEKPIDGIDRNGTIPQRLCYLHYHPVRRNVLCEHDTADDRLATHHSARTAKWCAAIAAASAIISIITAAI